MSRSLDRTMKALSGNGLSVLEGLGKFISSRFAVSDIDKKALLRFLVLFKKRAELWSSQSWALQTFVESCQFPELYTSAEKPLMRKRIAGTVLCLLLKSTYYVPSLITSKSFKKSCSRLRMLQTGTLTDSCDIPHPVKPVMLLRNIARCLGFTAALFAVDPVFRKLTARARTMLSSALSPG